MLCGAETWEATLLQYVHYCDMLTSVLSTADLRPMCGYRAGWHPPIDILVNEKIRDWKKAREKHAENKIAVIEAWQHRWRFIEMAMDAAAYPGPQPMACMPTWHGQIPTDSSPDGTQMFWQIFQ